MEAINKYLWCIASLFCSIGIAGIVLTISGCPLPSHLKQKITHCLAPHKHSYSCWIAILLPPTFHVWRGVVTVSQHLSFAAVAKALSHISLHISLFLSSSPLSWLCSWMIESAILYASCLSLVLCGGEWDRAADTERELQLLMTVRSGKDEAVLFDKLLFERGRHPRGEWFC